MPNFHMPGKTILTVLFSLFLAAKMSFPQDIKGIHNVLYINSYAMSYPWTDSLVTGVQNVFSGRSDIQLYIEFLDAKRFGKSQFKHLLTLFLDKYKNIRFDVVITSDNDALDFMMLYGDTIAPGAPVTFCGINNPQDYDFENSEYYGILDAVDLKTEINLIIQVIPEVKKLYFITDRSTTSLLNQSYVKQLEKEYAHHLVFEYIHNYSLEELLEAVTKFEMGSAIALLNYYQDNKGNSVNPDAIYKEIVERTPVPIFMDSETMLGQGIAGGIINNGFNHGREIAQMAMKFIDHPGYKPATQVILPKGKYYFDYRILEKFNISRSLLPAGAIVINQPHPVDMQYIRHIIMLMGIIGFLILIIFLLYISAVKRKKAEVLVRQKLDEIQEKNIQLEQAQRQLNKMNTDLTVMNENLTKTHDALVATKKKSEESDRLKSAFLTNISHEIRTPLNAIIGFSALLNDSELTCDERCEYSGIISSNSEQLLRIIDDVLDLSKIEAGELKLYIESFSVHDFLNELADTYQQVINRNHVQLIVSKPDQRNHIFMKSDRARFKQIFSNLLSNAVKFTNKGTIEFGYSFNTPGEITFYVKDTGIGIEPKEMRHLFNRFWKGEKKEKKYYSGAGLGLAISKKLCESLGGKISVDSEPGAGTTFYIAFQDYIVNSHEFELQSPISPNLEHYNLKGFTIAIVEDEMANMYLLSRVLRSLHCEIMTFKTGKEIVDFFSEDNNSCVDLILMDIKMPDMDGVKASELIRIKHPEIPIIAQTAYALTEDIAKIRQSAFNDIIVKPIKTVVLVEKIRKFLYPEGAGKRLT